MIIDTHAHIFPDKIASKTISALALSAKTKAYLDGTVSALSKSVEEAGIDFAISLPVVTKPSQFESVNSFALSINERFNKGESKILSFAGIHPDCEDIEGKLKWIKANGFKGIKLHPEYQGVFIDEEKTLGILSFAKRLGLITVVHAGVDGAYRETEVKCTPKRVKNALKKLNGYENLVLAHFGGNELFDEVYELLAGEKVYFDTAYMLKYISEKDFKKMLEKHSADRILFATDSPWSGQSEDIEILKSFGLKEEDEQRIFSLNALKILGLEDK